jgi:pyruvate/2-oxoglutarate dehydrogenase complex dihydrolipoamide acyltransferase (E2) component
MTGHRIAIIVPEGVSLTAQEIAIGGWLKQPGDSVKRGEVIAEILTDKATLELEAVEAGRIAEIVAADGAEVTVGEVIAWLETNG